MSSISSPVPDFATELGCTDDFDLALTVAAIHAAEIELSHQKNCTKTCYISQEKSNTTEGTTERRRPAAIMTKVVNKMAGQC